MNDTMTIEADAEVVAVEEPKKLDLMLHAGARAVSRETLAQVWTPEKTETWTPLPHMDLVEGVERALDSAGLKVMQAAHSLTRSGQRYFGMMQIQNGASHDDYAWVLGLRNSHDKTYPAGIVAGASVFVCDNLSFSGEVKIFRKHTVFIKRDLPNVTARAIGQLMEHWHDQDERIEAYKATDLTDEKAHDLLIRSLDVRAVAPTRLPEVLAEWRKPRHEEFGPRNVWSMFNSFTEVLKGGSLTELPRRTQALHGMLDNFVGLHGKN